MTTIRQLLRRSSLFLSATALIAAWIVGDASLFISHASAAQITSRSLQISSSANGSLAAGQGITYTLGFTVPGAASTVQSIDLQFCSTPLPGTDCNIRAGQSVSSVTLGTPTGLTGWSLGTAGNAPSNSWSNGTSGTGGRIRLTRTNASNVSSATPATIVLNNITNPSTDNQTFFVRIVTYTDTAWTTTRDNGTVANSTAEQIDITAKVQETLNFSVGTTATDPLNSCEPLTGSSLLLGLQPDGVLNFSQAYDSHSYFRVSTNANNGTIIYYSGDTLKYGSNDINAIGTTATASDVGAEQFGLAIDSGDATANGYSFASLSATAPYNVGNGTITDGGTATFAFDTTSVTTPRQIASTSPAATIVCDTGSVRYLGNISTTTPPGVYTTTITYLALPTY